MCSFHFILTTTKLIACLSATYDTTASITMSNEFPCFPVLGNKGENIIIESFPLCVGSKLVIVCLNLLVIHSKLFSGTLYRTCRHCERSVGNTVLIEYVYYNLSFPLRLPPNTLSVKPSIFARNCLHFWEAKSFSIQFARTILSDHTLYEAVTPWHKPVKGFQCQYHCLSPAAQFPIQRCAS